MLQFQSCSEKAAKLTRFSSVSFKIVLVSYGKLNISNNQTCHLLYTSVKPWRNHSKGWLKNAGFCFGVSVFFQFLASGSNTEWPEVTDVCWSILKKPDLTSLSPGPRDTPYRALARASCSARVPQGRHPESASFPKKLVLGAQAYR